MVLSFIHIGSRRKKGKKDLNVKPNSIYQASSYSTSTRFSPQEVINIDERSSIVPSTITGEQVTIVSNRSKETSPAIQLEFHHESLIDTFSEGLVKQENGRKERKLTEPPLLEVPSKTKRDLDEAQRLKGSLPVTPVSSSGRDFPTLPSPVRQTTPIIHTAPAPAPAPPSSFHRRPARTTSMGSEKDGVSTISGLTMLLEPFGSGFYSPVSSERDRRSGLPSGTNLTRGDSMTLPKEIYRKSKESEMMTPRSSRTSRNNNNNIPPLPSPAVSRSDSSVFNTKQAVTEKSDNSHVGATIPPLPVLVPNVNNMNIEESQDLSRISRISERSSPVSSRIASVKGKSRKGSNQTLNPSTSNSVTPISTPSSSFVNVITVRSEESSSAQFAERREFSSYPSAPATNSSNGSDYNVLSSSPVSWRSNPSRGNDSNDGRRRRSRSRSSRKSISSKSKHISVKLLTDKRVIKSSMTSPTSNISLLPIGDRRGSMQSNVSSLKQEDVRRLSSLIAQSTGQSIDQKSPQVTVSPPANDNRVSSPDLWDMLVSDSPNDKPMARLGSHRRRSGIPTPIHVLSPKRPYETYIEGSEADVALTPSEHGQTLPETPDLFSPFLDMDRERPTDNANDLNRYNTPSPGLTEAANLANHQIFHQDNDSHEESVTKPQSPGNSLFSTQLISPLKPPPTPPSTDTSPSLISLSFPSTPPAFKTSHLPSELPSLRNTESNSSLRKARARPPAPFGPRRPSQQSLVIGGSPSSSNPSRLRSGSTASTIQAGDNLRTKNYQPSFYSIDFTPVPVPWKGVTVEEAKWTFSPNHLQNIASRAIRESAKATKLRLLRLEVLEEQLPAETDRLKALLNDLKVDYKVQVRRRQQLLESLRMSEEGTKDSAIMARIVEDLLEIASSCDVTCERLYRVRDQLAQMESLKEIHYSSALAMALRKLNGSYVKQTRELADCRQELALVTAEKDDILKHAEEIAKDYDELNEGITQGDLQAMDEKLPGSRRSSYASKTSRRFSQASLRLSRVSSRHNLRFSVNSPRLSISGIRSPLFLGDAPPVPPVPRLTISPDRGNNGSPLDAGSDTGTWDKEQRDLLEQLGISPKDLTGAPSRPLSAVVPGSLRPESPTMSEFGTSTNSRSTSHTRTSSLPEDLRPSREEIIRHDPETILAMLQLPPV